MSLLKNGVDAIYVFGGMNNNNIPIPELYWWNRNGWNRYGNLHISRFGHRTISTSPNQWMHIGGVGTKPIERYTNKTIIEVSKLVLDNYAWYPEIFPVTTSDFLPCM